MRILPFSIVCNGGRELILSFINLQSSIKLQIRLVPSTMLPLTMLSLSISSGSDLIYVFRDGVAILPLFNGPVVSERLPQNSINSSKAIEKFVGIQYLTSETT